MARRKYAQVWWTVDDLSEEVAQNEIEMTDKEAHEFLSSIEKRLEEAMIATGWTVIQDALSELERSRESQATPVP